MVLFFVCLLALAGVTGAALELVTHAQATQTTSQASRRASNVQLMAVHLDGYAQAHPSTVGKVSTAALNLPAWYVPYPGVGAYVEQGAAYLYQPTAAVSYLRDVAGPGVVAGIKQASGAVTDMTGRTVALLGKGSRYAIPTGSAVVVVHHAIDDTVPAPAVANADPLSPAGLPAGASLSAPETFAPVASGTPVAWAPWVPKAPDAPPRPPLNPLPAPSWASDTTPCAGRSSTHNAVGDQSLIFSPDGTWEKVNGPLDYYTFTVASGRWYGSGTPKSGAYEIRMTGGESYVQIFMCTGIDVGICPVGTSTRNTIDTGWITLDHDVSISVHASAASNVNYGSSANDRKTVTISIRQKDLHTNATSGDGYVCAMAIAISSR